MRRLGVALCTLAVAAVAALTVSAPADASRFIRSGVFDDGLILYNDPTEVFPLLESANTQTIRVNLWWGGRPVGVAKRRPQVAADPADPAYDWDTYDRTVLYAAPSRIAVLFSIIGTPPWANGRRAWNVAPTKAPDLQAFARAAARRYSGTYRLENGQRLPKVRFWLVWNEPNNPVFLRPQFVRRGGRWIAQSPKDYARMCNAAIRGIKSVAGSGKVACGATGPRGNNIAGGARASISPLAFLRGMRLAGAKGFDAYAHHPYYGTRAETPLTAPPPGRRGRPTTAVTLGNFNTLVRELTRLYGSKRIWITEYGYQTMPPDPLFGVSYRKQAAYLREAYAYARRHPRVDLFLWFLMRDDPSPAGWQSGFITAAGRKKPSFAAFANLNG